MRLTTSIRPAVASARASTTGIRTMAGGAKFAKYDWQDPLKMQGLLTEEELAIQETARSYAQDKLAPRALEGWRTVRIRAGLEA